MPSDGGEERGIIERRRDQDGGPGAGVEHADAVALVDVPGADDPWEGFALDDSVFRSAGGEDEG